MTKRETDDGKKELEELIEVVEDDFETKHDIIVWKNIAYLILLIIVLSSLVYIIVLVIWGLAPFFGELPIESKVETLIAEVALLVAFISLSVNPPVILLKRKMTYQEHVDLNYEKKKSKVEEGQRPLLKALIMMKCKQPDFSLSEMDESLFEKKKLLSKLYE